MELDGHLLYLVHALPDLDLKPEAAGIAAVIYGHSHKPAIAWKHGVLYFNPGSAGPRRFHLPLSVAFLHIRPNTTPGTIPATGDAILRPELVYL